MAVCRCCCVLVVVWLWDFVDCLRCKNRGLKKLWKKGYVVKLSAVYIQVNRQNDQYELDIKAIQDLALIEQFEKNKKDVDTQLIWNKDAADAAVDSQNRRLEEAKGEVGQKLEDQKISMQRTRLANRSNVLDAKAAARDDVSVLFSPEASGGAGATRFSKVGRAGPQVPTTHRNNEGQGNQSEMRWRQDVGGREADGSPTISPAAIKEKI